MFETTVRTVDRDDRPCKEVVGRYGVDVREWAIDEKLECRWECSREKAIGESSQVVECVFYNKAVLCLFVGK